MGEFGDNTNARAAKAALLERQRVETITLEAYDGSLYRVYPDIPPGTGWVVKRVGTYAVPKQYLATRQRAIDYVNVAARRFALGDSPDTKAGRRLK